MNPICFCYYEINLVSEATTPQIKILKHILGKILKTIKDAFRLLIFLHNRPYKAIYHHKF